LPALARDAIADSGNEAFVSAASIWEIAIKRALGRLDFPAEGIAAILEQADFTPLPIIVAHAERAGALPPLHHDPFDRMLIAQAQHEGMTLVTVDGWIRRYPVAVLGG
jgi:PIN domain nuclease of toxin-antitoxin system